MLYGLGGGFIVAVLFFIFIHYRVYKSNYYKDEFVYFSSEKKVVFYIGFLIVNFFVAYILLFVFMLLIMAIANLFLK